MIQSLRIRGSFRGSSGHDNHVRAFTRELTRQGVRVQLIDVPEWNAGSLPDHLRDPWFEQFNQSVDARITLHFVMPFQVIDDGRTLSVNYTMFEATRVPTDWINHNRTHRRVIVPTESSRRAWVDSGFPAESIQICPLGIDPARYAVKAAPLPLNTQSGRPVATYRTRFLNVSELVPRKNLIGLLTAWLLATHRDDDALLMIKLAVYARDRFEPFMQQLKQIERRCGRRFRDAAPIEFLFDILADRELPRLYAAATHYISLSHGEGWDLPMIEAAASCLSLIAPDHSAYRAYLTSEIATLIPSREVPARFAGDPELRRFFAGANWWEPDVEAAAEAIHDAIRRPDETRSSAREHILAHFTWEQSTMRLIEILSEL